MDLDLNDIETLIDAVSAWQSKDSMHEIINTMLTAAFVPQDKREELKAKDDEQKIEREAKARVTSERAVLLKAKLIGMKDRLIAHNALA